MKLTAAFVVVAALAPNLNCDRRVVNMGAPQSSHQRVEPIVAIRANAKQLLSQPLSLRWTISNTSNDPIYVYSTFLNHAYQIPAFSYTVLDPHQKLITIHFTRLKPLPFSPNSFPTAELMKIGPHESQEGNFATQAPVREEVFYASGNIETPEQISAGVWRVRIVIGYGHETSSVREMLQRSLADGKEHPINPIVRWQRLAYSNELQVDFGK